MESLEEEDLLYLDYYLDGNDGCSPDLMEFPSTWSPLSEEIALTDSSEPSTSGQTLDPGNVEEVQAEVESPFLPSQSPANAEKFLQNLRPVRKTKGVPQQRFVTYESFSPVRGKPFICKVCGMKLATKESNKRHLLSQHIKERPHECNICRKSFIFKFALKSHKAIHSDNPKFVCVCGMSFKLRTSFMNHIQRIHRAASEVKYRCELCFKSFGDRHTLRLHMISVHKPKTISCLQKGCNKVFSSISLMRCHYRYHLNRKYSCDKCGQSFSTESYMQKHRLTHLGVRPYTCLDCGKTYLSASHLGQHYRSSHSSGKVFQCSVCGKCFKSKDQLKYHESNHRGEKPYKCEVCGYATAYKNTYYAHRKKHQSTILSPDNVQEKSETTILNFSEGLKGNNSSKDKNRLRKINPLLKSKLNTRKENNISSKVGKLEVAPSVCNSNIKSLGIATSSSSSSSLSSSSASSLASSSSSSSSFASSSSSSSCNLKQANVDLIIFPPSVISCSEQLNEPLTDNTLQSAVNIVTYNKDDVNIDEQCIKENSDLMVKECIDKQVILDSEKTSSFIILSNNDRCAMSECENKEDSLLLVKIGDNSFASVCTHHTVADQMEISELNLNSVENLTLTTVDAKCLGTELTASVSTVTTSSPVDNIYSALNQESRSDNQEVLLALSSKNDKNILSANNVSQSTTLFAEYNENQISNSISMSLTQDESMEPSSSDGYRSEDMCPAVEIGSGMASLSSPIVDDSFRLTQLEVICPLCDEQFFCMDAYITHLECSHN